ncbi:MAG: rhodanese-like domain-containing protein [Pseudomonadota bacterium]
MTLSRRSTLALGGAFFIGVGAFGAVKVFSRSAAAKVLDPKEVWDAAGRGEVLLLDIRRPDEWAATGVAQHAVPLDMRRDDFIEALRALRRSDTQPVAVICARGVRSARLTHQLEAAEIKPIIDIPEGMLGSRAGPGWIERGLPVSHVG